MSQLEDIRKIRARIAKLARWIEGEPEMDMVYPFAVSAGNLMAALDCLNNAITLLNNRPLPPPPTPSFLDAALNENQGVYKP